MTGTAAATNPAASRAMRFDVTPRHAGRQHAREAFANPQMRRLLTAFACVMAAEWALIAAISVHAYRVGGALAVGLLGLRFVPAAAVGLVAARFIQRRQLGASCGSSPAAALCARPPWHWRLPAASRTASCSRCSRSTARSPRSTARRRRRCCPHSCRRGELDRLREPARHGR